MKVKAQHVIDKLSEYGLPLFTDYPTEDQGHCFISEQMILFLDEEDDSISVTFQADCKPEDSASKMLIISEIEDITDVSVMESFIYDKDNNFITGKEAHQLIRDTLLMDAFKKVAKQHSYAYILDNMECFNC